MQEPVSPKKFKFNERVYPSLWSLAPALLLTPSVALVAMPFIPPMGSFVVGFGFSLLALVALVAKSPRVSVVESSSDTRLIVGKASVSLKHLGVSSLIQADDSRAELGVNLNALAYLRLQAGVRTLVRVELKDPDDPTPYWIFSCRRGESLKAALES